MTLYNDHILPFMNYCNITWGSADEVHLQRITILQQKALKLCLKNQKALTACEMYYRQSLIFMNKYTRDLVLQNLMIFLQKDLVLQR